MSIRALLGFIAVFLTFAGYVPYIRDILRGKTQPHPYSWLLGGVLTAIAFALQLSGDAGTGAFATLAASILCWVVLGLSFYKKVKFDIAPMDTIFFVMALISLVLWLVAKQPVLSIILTTLTDVLGFIPTVRKSWNRPFTETLSSYWMNTGRFGLVLLSLERFSMLSALYPFTWFLGNGLFSVMLMVRRKQVK